MSNIYIQEPPTSGKVLLHTSLGDIDIELWSKETPKACRNFIQLCMERYYDGVIFHRIVKDFIAQGGDPSGTGKGGESIYGKPFKDEPHTRLRFVRRGLVAMANAGPDDNGSQFFFTLGPTQELQKKHTIFGKVAGDTIYNMIKMNDLTVDDDERPYEPPKIKRTEVLSNPFDDIVPRATIKHEKGKKKKPKSQSQGKKDFKLLSFGEEAEEEEETLNEAAQTMRTKGKSAHDLANDPKLSSIAAPVVHSELTGELDEEEKAKLERVKEKLKQYDESKPSKEKSSGASTSRAEDLKKESRRLMKELTAKNKETPDVKENEKSEAEEHESEVLAEYRNEKAKYQEIKKSLKKGGSRENQTLALLEKFKKKLDTAASFTEKYGEDDMDDDDEKDGEEAKEAGEESDVGWLGHKLEFSDKHHKVLDANITDIDRYEIYDPRNPMVKRRREESSKQAKSAAKKARNAL